jgi:hypothetical protein
MLVLGADAPGVSIRTTSLSWTSSFDESLGFRAS